MQAYQAKVQIKLKAGILDPQGKAVEHACSSLGFDSIADVRVGKMIEFSIEASDKTAAQNVVKAACERLLANPVIEEYQFSLHATQGEAA